MRYQAAHGLQVDGIAGPHTLAALTGGGIVLRAGAGYPSGSSDVRHLQRLLAKSGISPGPIDGFFGPLTALAVSRYQATHGLPDHGVAGPRTWPLWAGAVQRRARRRPAAPSAPAPTSSAPAAPAAPAPPAGTTPNPPAPWPNPIQPHPARRTHDSNRLDHRPLVVGGSVAGGCARNAALRAAAQRWRLAGAQDA